MGIEANTVSAVRQVKDKDVVRIEDRGAPLNVLFFGNSITRHAPKEEIGWHGDWGMAASRKERDYVHLTAKGLEKKYGPVNVCTVCAADWERSYWDDSEMERLMPARDFAADIVICRIGENIWGVRDRLKEYPLAPCLDGVIKWLAVKSTAKIVITTLFWAYGEIDDAIVRVAEANGYPLVRLGDLGELDTCKALSEYTHAGVRIHPNDEGMRRISDRILEKL